jgi:hypothetical protein
MKGKIKISYDGMGETEALIYVHKVIGMGRISASDTQYCWVTAFENPKNPHEKIYVSADKTKSGMDTFKVYKVTPKEVGR